MLKEYNGNRIHWDNLSKRHYTEACSRKQHQEEQRNEKSACHVCHARSMWDGKHRYNFGSYSFRLLSTMVFPKEIWDKYSTLDARGNPTFESDYGGSVTKSVLECNLPCSVISCKDCNYYRKSSNL